VDLIPKWQVLLTQGLGFLLVVVVFYRYLWGPIQGIIDARRDEVEKTYSAAEDDRSAAADLKAGYEQHLANIDAEMRAKITEAAKEGQTLREEIVAEARAKAEQVLARAEEEIGREKDKAILEIKTRVADLAVNAAGKLIDEHLDDEKHRQLVENYIDELEEVAK
jgi:F-type H+-transporting ATPase subunit b